MRVASFFSGIGGFDLGFERAGCEVVFQCEVDKFCQKVLKKHWPDVALVSDICSVSLNDIVHADIWCAGFPCQDLSLANQGKREGLNGKRSGLFYVFTELLAESRPKWIVLENVVGLLNSDNGEDFKRVLSELDELGYHISWRVLDSKYFGTPQRRRRVFIVGCLEQGSSSRVLFDESAIREMAPASRLPGAHSAPRTSHKFRDSDIFVIQHATIGRKPTAGPQAKGYRCDGETYTIDSRGSADVVCATFNGFRVRNSSGIPGELDSRRLRAIGNAVNVDVVTWLAKKIVQEENRKKEESYKGIGVLGTASR